MNGCNLGCPFLFWRNRGFSDFQAKKYGFCPKKTGGISKIRMLQKGLLLIFFLQFFFVIHAVYEPNEVEILLTFLFPKNILYVFKK
jgi:hypothetical protein